MFWTQANRRALSTFLLPYCVRRVLTKSMTLSKKVVACGMQAFQQLCGFNTLMYYSASLFQEIGFNQPTAVGLIISGTNFIFTLIALKFVL